MCNDCDVSGAARILVVDDDFDVRDVVTATLEGTGYVTESVPDAAEATKALDDFRPDLAVVDVSLNGTDGFTFVRRLRDRSDIPVLFLSGHSEVEDRLKGFRSGGDDYLVKPFDGQELVARVHALLRRTGRDSSGTWQVGDLLVDRGRREVSRRGQSIVLTKLEFDLVDMFGRQPGRVWEKDVLAGQLWGSDVYDLNLVEVHISQLRRKLEAHGQRLIHTIRGVGYVLRVPPAT